MTRFPTYKHSRKFKITNSALLGQDVLSENDVHLLMRRINSHYGEDGDFRSLSTAPDVRQIVNALGSRDGGYVLTPQQVEKGRAWLNKHRNDMGAREEAVMDDFETIRLVGTAPGEYNAYQYPYYMVLSKPDSEGRHGSFEYKVEGGRLHILG